MSQRTPFRGRTHVTRTRVRFGETDAAGIVFYPAYFAWFDLGTHGLMRGAGATRDELGRPEPMLPIVEAGATFSAPLHHDDEIAIRSSVVELGTASLRVHHVILLGEREVARGFEVRVMVRHDGARLIASPVTDELRAGLAGTHATADEQA